MHHRLPEAQGRGLIVSSSFSRICMFILAIKETEGSRMERVCMYVCAWCRKGFEKKSIKREVEREGDDLVICTPIFSKL